MQRIGPYLVQELLGQGGVGAVFRALDPGGRAVALKLLQVASDTRLQRFQREAQSLVRIRHPHVVQALDAGVDKGRPYLVMELVEGESLAERLRGPDLLSPDQVIAVGIQLAAALAHVHEQGLIHRDVKPGNVLLDAQGRPRLTDFGLALEREAEDSARLTRSGLVLGTPGYWAPEQAAGERGRIGPWTDVYSLGATLWALLVGQAPCMGESLSECVQRTLFEPPPPASSLRPGVAPALDAVLQRCLAKEPEGRYPSMTALGEDLRACRHAPAARPRRGGRWLLGLGALLALAGAGLVWATRDRPLPAPPAAAPVEPVAGPGRSATPDQPAVDRPPPRVWPAPLPPGGSRRWQLVWTNQEPGKEVPHSCDLLFEEEGAAEVDGSSTLELRVLAIKSAYAYNEVSSLTYDSRERGAISTLTSRELEPLVGQLFLLEVATASGAVRSARWAAHPPLPVPVDEGALVGAESLAADIGSAARLCFSGEAIGGYFEAAAHLLPTAGLEPLTDPEGSLGGELTLVLGLQVTWGLEILRRVRWEDRALAIEHSPPWTVVPISGLQLRERALLRRVTSRRGRASFDERGLRRSEVELEFEVRLHADRPVDMTTTRFELTRLDE